MKIVIPEFDDQKPHQIHLSIDNHGMIFNSSPVKWFEASEDDPLKGTAILETPEGNEYPWGINFRSPDEYPKHGQEILVVRENISARELVDGGFLEVIPAEERKEVRRLAKKNLYIHVDVACIVNGTSYLTKKYERFVHPIVREMFKDAERV